MVVSRIHFRALDGFGDFCRQILHSVYTTFECPQSMRLFARCHARKSTLSRQLSGESHAESAHGPRTHVPTPCAAAGEHGVTNLLHGMAWDVAHAVTNRAKLRLTITFAPDIGIASM
jgi:hypothetical protein